MSHVQCQVLLGWQPQGGGNLRHLQPRASLRPALGLRGAPNNVLVFCRRTLQMRKPRPRQRQPLAQVTQAPASRPTLPRRVQLSCAEECGPRETQLCAEPPAATLGWQFQIPAGCGHMCTALDASHHLVCVATRHLQGTCVSGMCVSGCVVCVCAAMSHLTRGAGGPHTASWV